MEGEKVLMSEYLQEGAGWKQSVTHGKDEEQITTQAVWASSSSLINPTWWNYEHGNFKVYEYSDARVFEIVWRMGGCGQVALLTLLTMSFKGSVALVYVLFHLESHMTYLARNTVKDTLDTFQSAPITIYVMLWKSLKFFGN